MEFIFNEKTGKFEEYKPYKVVKIACKTEEDYLKALEWLKKDEPQKPIPSKTEINLVVQV